MTPREAFERLLAWAVLDSRHLGRPGEVVERLPADTREALGRLTAADTNDRTAALYVERPRRLRDYVGGDMLDALDARLQERERHYNEDRD